MSEDLLKNVWINKDNGHHVVILENKQLNSTKRKLTTVYYLADLSTHRVIGTAHVEDPELAANMMFNTLESAGIEFEIQKQETQKPKDKKKPDFVPTPLGDGPTPEPIVAKVNDDLSEQPHVRLTD